MKIFLIILALSSLLLFSSDDSQYAQTIRETAKAMGYQLSEDELETWIERLKSYNSNDIEKFDEDINAFVEQDFINPPKKNEFLFIGSSSIRLWKSLQEDMAPLNVLNRGFGGAHIKHINRHFDSIVLPYEPKAIIFFCGTNDIAAYNPVEKVKLDFEIFYNRVKRDLPNTKLFVIEIQPSPSRFFQRNLQLKWNDHIEDLAKVDPNLFVINVSETMFTEDGKPRRELYIPDMLHMNPRGYAIWTGKVRDILRENYPIEMGKQLPCERLFGCPREFSPSDLQPVVEEMTEEVNT